MQRMLLELEKRLDAGLKELGLEQNPVLRYGLCIALVRGSIGELKAYMEANPFRGMAEEIHYFREFAPGIYSRLFYFMKLQQVESFRQYASGARFREALERELQGIDDFFLRHNDICRYYYQQTRYWDEQLFTRRGREHWPVDDVGIIMDGDFCLGSYWVSWIKANEGYRVWLEAELNRLARTEWGRLASAETEEEEGSGKAPVLEWTDTQTDLVELINGIHAAGSCNKGKADIIKIVKWFEFYLKVDLGHFYNTFQEIARRKKSRTKYIDKMREALLKKMDQDLED